jgi:signal transduction histidine kinase
MRQKAERAISSRDEFLSVASHELKTPLTSLKLQLQMAERRVKPELGLMPVPEKIVHSIRSSLKQTERLTKLVDELLDVSRIQSGKLMFQFEELKLQEVLGEVIARFDDQLRQVNCLIQTEIPSELRVNWDRSRFEQVVANLLSNAIKYAPGKPIHIKSSLAGTMVRFVVQDFGPGIPKEKQDRIFDRFERATHSRNISGLGLGLYIVRQIIDGHRGSIHVESEPELGSSFVIDIPQDPTSVEYSSPVGKSHAEP